MQSFISSVGSSVGRFGSQVLVLSVIALVGLNGCSKKSNNAASAAPQAKALSDQEKARFDKTAQSVSRSVKWKKDPANVQREGAETRPDPTAENEEKLAQLVNENCIFTDLTKIPQVQPQMDSSDTKPFESVVGLKVSGESCPITFEFNENMTNDPKTSSFKQGLQVRFQAKGEEAQKLSEVRLYELEVNVTGVMSQNSGSTTVTGKGTIELQSEGKVQVSIAGSSVDSEPAGSGQVAIQFKYADGLLVELKTTSSRKGQTAVNRFYLNNKSIEEKTFLDYMRKFKLDSFAGEEQSNMTIKEMRPGEPEIAPDMNIEFQQEAQ